MTCHTGPYANGHPDMAVGRPPATIIEKKCTKRRILVARFRTLVDSLYPSMMPGQKNKKKLSSGTVPKDWYMIGIGGGK